MDTQVSTDTTFNITPDTAIDFAEGTKSVVDDAVLFAEAVGRHMLRMGAAEGRVDSITIIPSKRTKEGWLEWLLKYEFSSGGKLTVGAIQRTPGAQMEFHS